MNQFSISVGIDVARDTLAVSIYDGVSHTYKELKYNKTTIKKRLIEKFLEEKESVVFVLESTGVYHTKLAYQLQENGFSVSVLNPLIIKRYMQMKMARLKTDKSDAQYIAEYGYDYRETIDIFKPKRDSMIEMEHLVKSLDILTSQKSMISNQQHALKRQPHFSKEVSKMCERHIKFIDREVVVLENKLIRILRTRFKTEHQLLMSIPGIGMKASSTIIAVFNAFENFESAKQVISFIGISPSLYESGISIRGRGTISKQGNPFARKVLFMAALTATRYNPLIKKQYQKLIRQGKNKIQALIAALNKLLRQAFGVLKSGVPFHRQYVEMYT
jgi:transposase